MDKIHRAYESMLDRIIKIGPDVALAVLILILGILTAFALKKVSYWLIKKLHTSNAGILSKVIKGNQLNSFANLLSRLIFWTTVFVFIVFSAELFGVDVLSEWVKLLTTYIPNVLAGIMILISGSIFAGIVRDFLGKTAQAAGFENSHSIAVVSYVSIFSIVVLIAIRQVGIDVDFLTSVILVVVACLLLGGAISFGIGAAPIVTNILSTYYLRKDLKIGQWIDGEGFSGKVICIGSASVSLQTSEGTQVIPSRILNQTGYKAKNVSH